LPRSLAVPESNAVRLIQAVTNLADMLSPTIRQAAIRDDHAARQRHHSR
jgi:hypothetical protein